MRVLVDFLEPVVYVHVINATAKIGAAAAAAAAACEPSERRASVRFFSVDMPGKKKITKTPRFK